LRSVEIHGDSPETLQKIDKKKREKEGKELGPFTGEIEENYDRRCQKKQGREKTEPFSPDTSVKQEHNQGENERSQVYDALETEDLIHPVEDKLRDPVLGQNEFYPL